MIKAEIDYPDFLPLPLLSSNTRSKGQTFVRTDEKGGMAKQRKSFAFQNSEMPISFVFSVWQAFMFENFFYSKSGLNNGCRWFNIKRRTADGLELITCRFIEPFVSSPVGSSHFSYNARVEVLNDKVSR